MSAGEAMIKQVAHMFKIIGMEEDGMRFYTNFIMIGQHSQGMASKASQQSTMKQIENVLISMYEDFERVMESIRLEEKADGVSKEHLLLDQFQFSKYYAGLQKIIIACIEDYGESIMSLFGIDSLLLFLKQIDEVVKQKGIQIIEHFVINAKIEKLYKNYKVNQDGGLADFTQLNQDQEYELELLCEEIANISYYFETYRYYVLNFLYF